MIYTIAFDKCHIEENGELEFLTPDNLPDLTSCKSLIDKDVRERFNADLNPENFYYMYKIFEHDNTISDEYGDPILIQWLSMEDFLAEEGYFNQEKLQENDDTQSA